jgi:hypothetical protein
MITIRIEAPYCVYYREKDGVKNYGYGTPHNAFKGVAVHSTVNIVSYHDTLAAARSAMTVLCGYVVDPILCHQTGDIFPTSYAAAVAYGIHPQSLSNHLNGRRGYEHPKGYTFQRIPKEIA